MIGQIYTLFTRVPLYKGADGTLYAGDLWEKDLSLHLEYLPRFRICCPLLPHDAGDAKLVPVRGLGAAQVTPLREDHGWGSVFFNLLPNFVQVARAARRTEIAQSEGAGWAFPLSYYVLLLRPFLRFRWLMNVESSFWMVSATERASLRKRLSERVHRVLLRRCLRAADMRVFTQDWYRRELLEHEENSLIAPASWIDEEAVLAAPPERAAGALRLIWPTRMVPEKGIDSVIAALADYARIPGAAPLAIDAIGQGPLAARLHAAAETQRGPVTLRVFDPVPYGAPFFALIRGYDGVLIANLTEEQPRIAFDAFSQALPCVASATNGNRSVIRAGETGHLFAPGDAAALAALLHRLAADPAALRAMSGAALEAARRHTHRAMHRAREVFLKTCLGEAA